MNRWFLILAAILLATFARADNTNRLDGLGVQFRVLGKNSISVLPYPDRHLWVNGVRVETHYSGEYTVRVGDRVDDWEAGRCFRYQLNRLHGKHATFTRWTYASRQTYLGVGLERLSSGPLLAKEEFTADLEGLAIVDWDPINYVEMSESNTNRSKLP